MNYETTRTVNILKKDARTKDGVRKFKSIDVEVPENLLDTLIAALNKKFPENKYVVEVVNTYVERVSAADNKTTFWERYDTPYYCSPSSETYWCS